MSKTYSEAERQQRREADRKRSREAVQALQSSEGWVRWLASRRHFHQYSLSNQLLIAMQCPHATRVAGFRAWLKLGYCVRRGERALRIWVPMPPSQKELEAWRRAGAVAAEKPRTRFRLGPVFDRSQVQELPPPAKPISLDPPICLIDGDDLAWAMTPLTRLADELGATVVVEAMPESQGGFFDPYIQTIGLNERRSVNHRVKTLIHELGHALLRQRTPADGAPAFSYSEEELVVESVAYTVCGSIGLDTSDYSIPYLASWSERAGLDTIQAAAQTIDQIAKRIEEQIKQGETNAGEALGGEPVQSVS
jgi:antirestriction protein ArdC